MSDSILVEVDPGPEAPLAGCTTWQEGKARQVEERGKEGISKYLFEVCFHDLRTVVDGKNDVSDTSLCKGLDLMLDHGLVAKLHQGLRKSQGL